MNEEIMAFLVSISAGAIIAILTWVLHKRGGFLTAILFAVAISLLPAAYFWNYWRPQVLPADLSFSDFNNCAPLTNQGFHWGIFSDYPYRGNSTLQPSIHEKGPNECNLVLTYALSDSALVSPYCGIYAGFSARPAIPRDVSGYRGIQLELGHMGEMPDDVLVFIELSPLATINSYEGYYRYDLTSLMGENELRLVQANFEDFVAAPQLRKSVAAFNKNLRKELYQIAIIVAGKGPSISSQGKISVDNIEFF